MLLTRPRRRDVRIRPEPLPDPAVLAQVEEMEAEQLRRHVTRAGALSLDEWAEWLRLMLPDHVHGHHQGPPPPEPTAADPGSLAKIQALRQRAAARLSLHHSGDGRSSDSARGLLLGFRRLLLRIYGAETIRDILGDRQYAELFAGAEEDTHHA